MLLADWTRQGSSATQWRQFCHRTPRAQAATDRPSKQVSEGSDAPTDSAGGYFVANKPGLEILMVDL